MKITFVSVGERIGYKASYNHKGVQIVEFAPTRMKTIEAVLNYIKKFLIK